MNDVIFLKWPPKCSRNRNPTKTSLSKITATKNNLGEYIGSHTRNWEYETNI